MKKVIFFILCSVIGVVCSMLILLLLEPIHIYFTCGLATGLVGSILYYGFLAKSNMKLVISVVVGILVFILYYLLYTYVNVNSEMGVIPFIVFVAPYVLASIMYFLIKSLEKPNENEQATENDTDKKEN